MASAVCPIRNQAHWAHHKVYMRKFNNNNTLLPSRFNCNNPNFQNPNPNPSILLNQTSNTITNPNPTRFLSNSSQNQQPPRYSAPPPAADAGTGDIVDLEVEFSPGQLLVFHLNSYSKRDITELRNRFVSELQQIRLIRNRVEAREVELRSNRIASAVAPVTTTAAVPAVAKKKSSGRKRAMPFGNSSGKVAKRAANGNGGGGCGAGEKVVKAMMRKCGQMLGKLMKHKHGWVFNKPVDTVTLGLHNYYDVIKCPMDLGTVKAKLGKFVYKWPLDFAGDVRLTFENAMLYNAKGDDAHTMASVLLDLFDGMFNPAYRKFEADHQRVVAVAQQKLREPLIDLGLVKEKVVKPLGELVVSQETLSNKSLLIQEPSCSMASPREAVSKPVIMGEKKVLKPKRKEAVTVEMSLAEREKLGFKLQNLTLDQMDEVLEIVRRRNSDLVGPNMDGEIELDFEALDNQTLWDLDRFVKSCTDAAATNEMGKEELVSNSTPSVLPVHPNKEPQHVVEPVINKGEEDVDIGDEMPMNDYPPLEIERDVVSSPAHSERSRNTGNSSSDSDSSSSSDSDSDSSSGCDTDVNC